MALFGNNQESSISENQHYIDFLNSQKLSINELKETKLAIFELVKKIDASLISTSQNTTIFEKLKDYLAPAGRENSYERLRQATYGGGNDSDVLKSLKDFFSNNAYTKTFEQQSFTAKGLWEELKTIGITALLTTLALPFIGPVLKWFDEVFGTELKQKFDAITRPFSGYISTVQGWMTKTMNYFENFTENVTKDWHNLMNWLNAQFNKYFDQFLSFIGGSAKADNVFKKVSDSISRYFNLFIGNVGEFVTNHKDSFSKLYENVLVQFHVFTASLEEFMIKHKLTFNDIYNNAVVHFHKFMASVEQWADNNGFHDTYQALKNYFNSVYDTAKQFADALKPLWDSNKDVFSNIISLLKQLWDSGIIQAKIHIIMDDVSKKIATEAENLWKLITDKIGKMVSDLSNQLKNFINEKVQNVLMSYVGEDTFMNNMWGRGLRKMFVEKATGIDVDKNAKNIKAREDFLALKEKLKAERELKEIGRAHV